MSESSYYECCDNFGTHTRACVLATMKELNKKDNKMTGKIARIVPEKAFGFIHSNGTDYFFHKSGCVVDFERLQGGEEVQFEEEYSTKGPRATGVRLVNR